MNIIKPTKKIPDKTPYTTTIIKLIGSFIQHNIISRTYYNESIHPLVQDLFKTKDIERTCKDTWTSIIHEERDIETSLLLALNDAKKYDKEILCQ